MSGTCIDLKSGCFEFQMKRLNMCRYPFDRAKYAGKLDWLLWKSEWWGTQRVTIYFSVQGLIILNTVVRKETKWSYIEFDHNGDFLYSIADAFYCKMKYLN